MVLPFPFLLFLKGLIVAIPGYPLLGFGTVMEIPRIGDGKSGFAFHWHVFGR